MSPNEIKILTYLVTSDQPYCKYEDIINHVWGDIRLEDRMNSLKVTVCYARNHFKEYGIQVLSIRDVGYGIDPKDHAKARSILADIIKRKTGVDVPWAEHAA